ncbi:MAG TPA: hypothetical protein VE871_16975 [Longimicrobium sp.]|nr:hypothetical protein [Longimicrobium sp.]
MNASSGTSRTRRFTLLIGLLLHLLGVVAVPFHVWSPADPAGTSAFVAADPGDGSSLPVHDELHCVLCHAAGALALPQTSAHLFLAEAGERVEIAAPQHALPFRPASAARARAPPLA